MKHSKYLSWPAALLLCHALAMSAYASSQPSGAGDSEPPQQQQVSDSSHGRQALMAFEHMLRAYEAGDQTGFRSHLEVSMQGYQQLVDNVASEVSDCKQMRIALTDTQVQAAADTAFLQTAWEKRCLMLPSFTPKLVKGHSTLLMHNGAAGWSLMALSAGNMFERTPNPPPVVKPPVTPPPITPPPVTPPPPVITPPVAPPPVTPPPVVPPPVTPPPITPPPTTPPPVTPPPVTPPPVVTPVVPTACTVSGRPVSCSAISNPGACKLVGTTLVCP